VASPLPSLFSRLEDRDAATSESEPPAAGETEEEVLPEIEPEKSWWNIFGKMSDS
jgi:hypothetical protein